MNKWNLSQDLIDEGREHPFTEALLRELTTRHDEMVTKLRDFTAGGSPPKVIRVMAGRAMELHDTIRLIRTTEGQE